MNKPIIRLGLSFYPIFGLLPLKETADLFMDAILQIGRDLGNKRIKKTSQCTGVTKKRLAA